MNGPDSPDPLTLTKGASGGGVRAAPPVTGFARHCRSFAGCGDSSFLCSPAPSCCSPPAISGRRSTMELRQQPDRRWETREDYKVLDLLLSLAPTRAAR